MSPELKKLLIEWHDSAVLESVAPCSSPEKQAEALDDVALLEAVLFDSRPKQLGS